MLRRLVPEELTGGGRLRRAIFEQEADFEVVGHARNGREAVELAARLRPEMITMDIRMPVMDGIEATRRLAGGPRVLVLTTFDLDEYVYDALGAGASGFLLKDVAAERLKCAHVA